MLQGSRILQVLIPNLKELLDWRQKSQECVGDHIIPPGWGRRTICGHGSSGHWVARQDLQSVDEGQTTAVVEKVELMVHLGWLMKMQTLLIAGIGHRLRLISVA